MKYFYLIVFILSIFIVAKSYFNLLMEGFKTNGGDAINKTYILMGDSILQNDAYVSDGKSVETLLLERNKNTIGLAEDHSKITDVFLQVSKLPITLNDPNTYIFLSAGGNDILSYYVDQGKDITNTSFLTTMFKAYKKLVKSIQTRMPNAKLFLLDIYYPDNLTYQRFHSIIKEWNTMVYEFANNPQNKIDGVIKISNYLTQENDFSFGIEPSSIGGKKIVDLILQTQTS